MHLHLKALSVSYVVMKQDEGSVRDVKERIRKGSTPSSGDSSPVDPYRLRVPQIPTRAGSTTGPKEHRGSPPDPIAEKIKTTPTQHAFTYQTK